MKQIVYLAIFGLVLISCKSNKTVSKTNERDTSFSSAVEAVEESEFDFDTFEAKAKVRFEDEDRRLTFRTTIRIAKDEKIWISGGMLGFEGVRALITPDSVRIINKLEREYYQEPIEYLSEVSNLPVNFEGLQNLIIGNALFFDEDNVKYQEKEGIIELMSEWQDLVNILWLDTEDLLLERQTLISESEDRNMEISYYDYRPLSNGNFAHETEIYVSGQDESWIDMEFTNIELNKSLSFPFTVSSSYERVYQ